MAGLSSLGTRGVEPLSKKARPWSFLPVSSWYAHSVVHWFMLLLLSPTSALTLKGSAACSPLVVSSAVSVGDLAVVAPGSPWPVVALL
jgi:hypothetical protein